MPITVQQHILGLQVTVGDASAVEVRQRSNDLSGVQTGDLLIKYTLQQSAQRYQHSEIN